ncbi:MAG: ABC transporter ATP-binding protein [Gemmatimonadetes bacterium]|nr:ABC transporter ATP-binding protein [Gemmatimonadota bacterium]
MLIELRSAGKRYGRRPGVIALRPTNLAVAAGEVCAVVGPNGAGKSTLLALALGFLRPTTGQVLLVGAPPRDRHRAGGVAYLPERFSLPARWTVAGALRGLAALDREPDPGARVAAVLARCGLEEVRARPIGELSRGLLQRVGIAQAWLAPAQVLVLDEPTEGLDPLWRLRLRELVAERRAAGAAVLLASHDLAEVERMADRVVLLERGEVRGVLPARGPAGAGEYRQTLLAGAEHVPEVFPGATLEDTGTFRIAVADAHELSTRLAALLARGAVVVSVRPAVLEERIRPAYEERP